MTEQQQKAARETRAAPHYRESRQRLLERGYEQMTIQEMMQRARNWFWPHEKTQTPKRQTRYCYTDGPMFYLGQQIVKAMQDAGYPAHIFYCYRSPEKQVELRAKGRSKAGPWQSPHQFFEAVDIVHPARYWDVSPEYWRTLAACVKMVADKFGVHLEHGHYWRFTDSAHIELKDWRTVKTRMIEALPPGEVLKRPTSEQLASRFEEVLPAVWRQRPQSVR